MGYLIRLRSWDAMRTSSVWLHAPKWQTSAEEWQPPCRLQSVEVRHGEDAFGGNGAGEQCGVQVSKWLEKIKEWVVTAPRALRF
jgi:hypothetical protein